jgi:hypothetical protein
MAKVGELVAADCASPASQDRAHRGLVPDRPHFPVRPALAGSGPRDSELTPSLTPSLTASAGKPRRLSHAFWLFCHTISRNPRYMLHATCHMPGPVRNMQSTYETLQSTATKR